MGVQGRGSGIAGIGVQGIGGGIGVQATTTSGGFGLDVDNGRIRIGQVAGVATIPRGRTRVLVSPRVDVNARTFVVLTPQANIGARALWPTKLVGKNKLFIRMSSRRTVRTRVAWLALEHGLRVGLDPVQTEIPQWWGFRAG